MLEVYTSASVQLDTTAVIVRRKLTNVLQCRARTVPRVSITSGISVANVTRVSRVHSVKRTSMSVLVYHVETVERAEISSGNSSVRVLQGLLDFDVSPTWTSVPRHHARITGHAMILSGDSAASAFRVLPAVSARQTSMNAFHSHAAGLVP